ncbi:MAG: hypothetical protein HY863_03755 [Chloroflexi bacterium]|nr:hypothetical protein [Chloroflexota bacterium]
MRKSTLILSAIITAALIIALYSLVAAYQRAIQAPVPPTAVTSAEGSQEQPVDNATEAAVAGTISIYDAAAQAVNVLGRSDLYLVLNTQVNGVDVYLATFASGDIMYISKDGQVLSASKLEALSIYQPTSHSGK